jgi:ligand-binding sensor domain-containing protein/serine phosphatase RsbU (regulator of sigma subunit)
MRFNITLKSISSTIWCLFLFSAILNSQTYSFKNYGAESDIPNGFIYTINQSDNGYLWIGTNNGLSRFDGFNFFPVQYPDSSTLRYPTASLKDKNGTLWFGCSDGKVFYSMENKLVSVPISNSESIISNLLEGTDGLIYVFPQGGSIFSINPTNTEEVQKFIFSENPIISSACFTKSGNVLIGSQEKVLVCKMDGELISVIEVIEGLDYSNVTSIHNTEDSTMYLIGTDGNGLYQLRMSDKGNKLSRFINHPEWDYLDIQSISEDSRNDLWISTFGSGVIQFHLSDDYKSAKSVRLFNVNSGLIANDVTLVFQDIEGNYWIGLYGAGISMLKSYSFGYFKPGKNSPENNILYVNSYRDKYILGTPSGFHIFDPGAGKSDSFTDLTSQVGKTEITSYFFDREMNLWIGTGGNGLFLRNSIGSVKQYNRSGDSGADYINDIEVDSIYIWLATINGVRVINRNSGLEEMVLDMTNGLPHNYINKILLTQEGNAYIGTESNKLFVIDSNYNITSGNAIMYGSTINEILSIVRSKEGVIWAATRGNGIFEFNNDSVSAVNRSNDLMSNYCYSLLSDSENNIWVGHEKGVSIFNPESGTMRFFGTDFAKGGVCNPDGMFESADKKIFIGTTEGLIVYDKQLDKKNAVPPFNNINSIIINDKEYPFQPSISLPYRKNYTILVNYIGINFSDPGKVFYRTFMENYQKEWSKYSTEREVPFGLNVGRYKFNMNSVNEEGLSQSDPISFEIVISPPVWRRWWFIISVFVLVIGIIILIIRERDKAQKKIQEYLEKELEARTRVVMKQKAEIELQNIEITDSINYAKRIQTSILPDINKLKETFKDAFILFHPRDIVSGDFYWFDKLDDDKFVLVCADSTGHGVPGAFMSMIGSTLLQDIVTRMRITKPSQILTLLNRQIFSTLNQNVEMGVSNDGMDMVVCEFNAKTRHIRFAAAMRPVILIIGGESYYIKGNRLSVGGESIMEKYFDDQEYYLSEGDTVYLFSDGLSDQFGGTDGKKLKIARLKRLIEQISILPMGEQREVLSKFFFDWKGDYDQVDDILFMGVRV